MEKAIILLSGGQDSTTAALVARADPNVDVVGCLSIRYGQRHLVEITQAAKIAQILGFEIKIIDVPAFEQISHSNLVGLGGNINSQHGTNRDLPSSFVPGRNLVFLTLASAYAYKVGATLVYTGVCQTDYSGYPDCRRKTIRALAESIRLGMEFPDLEIVTPILNLSKAETFALGRKLGQGNLVLDETVTCYNGDRTIRNPWGYGCGDCPSCRIRRMGWEDYCSNKQELDDKIHHFVFWRSTSPW